MLDPNIFPRAKSTFLFTADIIPTTSSGREVPKAIIDNPITASEILNLLAKLIAELTNSSDPYIKNIIPIIIKIIEKNVEYALLFISSKFNDPFFI